MCDFVCAFHASLFKDISDDGERRSGEEEQGENACKGCLTHFMSTVVSLKVAPFNQRIMKIL